MNPAEYEIMASLEATHWWYRSLRELIWLSLDRFGNDLPAAPCILDAGCGTGENLRFLNRKYDQCDLSGFDLSPQAIELARRELEQAELYLSNICAPELRRESYDVVLSCDCIYIPGLAASMPGLQAMVARLRPGGLFIVNLPAFNQLRSDHDLAVHTSERFVRSQISELFDQLSLKPCLVTYRLFGLFPLFVASRLPSILWPQKDRAQASSALKPPHPITNYSFGKLMQWENRLIHRGWTMPLGSSVFGVGRKEAS